MDNDKLLKEIDRLLQQRFEHYPRRVEPTWSSLNAKLEKFAKNLTNEVLAKGQIKPPSKKIRDACKKIINSPVFIVGYYKTGTSLLLALLDSHPQLNVLPDEFVYFSIFKPRYHKFSWPLKLKILTSYSLRKIITPSGKPPFWTLGKPRGKGRMSYQNFVNNIYYFANKYCKNNNQALLTAVSLAYYATRIKNKSVSRKAKYWVEKTPTNEFRLRQILKPYPRAKFIHIVRDPRSTILSIGKMSSQEKDNKEFSLINGLKRIVYFVFHLFGIARSFRIIRRNKKKVDEQNYLVVKYEELVLHPRKIMKQIADFLKIKYSSSLLLPTTAGRLMVANSAWKRSRVKGKIHQQSQARWKKELSRKELSLINIITSDAAKACGCDL